MKTSLGLLVFLVCSSFSISIFFFNSLAFASDQCLELGGTWANVSYGCSQDPDSYGAYCNISNCYCGPDYDPDPLVSKVRCKQPAWLPSDRLCRYLLIEEVSFCKIEDGDDQDDENEDAPEDSCEITIEKTEHSYALNIGNGQNNILLNAYIHEEQNKPVLWQFEINGSTIGSGTGPFARANWTGFDQSHKAPGVQSYIATLTAETADGKCKGTATFKILITKEQNCQFKVQIGSAANVANGELTDSLNLFSAPGQPGFDLSLQYASFDAFNGTLGLSWHHSYDVSITENDFGEALLRQGSGIERLYQPSGTDYISQPGDYATLDRNPAGGWTLAAKSGGKAHFDPNGKLVARVDRNGNTLAFAYDTDGLLTSVSDASGRSVLFNYSDGKLFSVTDPAGQTYLFDVGETLNGVTFPDGGTTNFIYTANAFLTGKTDPLGYTTTYNYDDNHRVIESVDPEGQIRTINYPSGDEAVRTTTFTEKDGGVWQYKYDTTSGNLLDETDPQGGVTSYTYDTNHNMLRKTGPDGSLTSYTYDVQGNRTSLTDPGGNTTRHTYNAFGQTTSATDSAGNTTTYEYDDQGNLIKTTNWTGAKTTYGYDVQGNLTSVTNPLGQTTSMSYDFSGNLTSVTDASGATTLMGYDANGQLIKQVDPQGSTTHFEYDGRGNLLKTTDALGNITTSEYDAAGNRIQSIDANGHTTLYSYNYQGQMIAMIDAEGNETEFSYNGSSGCSSCGGGGGEKLTALTDANGNTTRFKYDSLGRLILKTDPLGNQTLYQYDASNNLTSKTKPDGHTINYSHDSLGHLLKTTYSDGTETSFSYDVQGHMVTATNQHISYSFTYDAADRITSVSDSFGRTISYEYDALGRKIRMIDPDGKQLRYRYDDAGRLAEILNGGSYQFSYDTLGRRTKLSYPNGVVTTYSYDAAGRLTGLAHQSSSAQIISQSQYNHDNAGNRLSKATEHNLTNYSYDKNYQLIEALSSAPGNSPTKHHGNKGKGTSNATQNQKEFYRYDPVGNRTTSSEHKIYSHNSGNQLLSTNQASYQYDVNGNLIAKINSSGTTYYQWDDENRLNQVTMPNGTVAHYQYDPFGRRIAKQVLSSTGTTTTNYLYDGEDILYQHDGTGNITHHFIHGPGIDEPLGLYTGDKGPYFYHADGLGSIVAMTDDQARNVQHYEYDSFGHQHDMNNRIKQPYGYTGREHDRETGLRYYRARYYDGEVGRFISEDPIGFDEGINPYAYVQNNPENNTDPTGGIAINVVGAGASAVADVIGQLIRNNGNWLCIDLVETGIAALTGAVLPGAAGTYAKAWLYGSKVTQNTQLGIISGVAVKANYAISPEIDGPYGRLTLMIGELIPGDDSCECQR